MTTQARQFHWEWNDANERNITQKEIETNERPNPRENEIRDSLEQKKSGQHVRLVGVRDCGHLNEDSLTQILKAPETLNCI